jgi:uncharacterized protein with PIN domain
MPTASFSFDPSLWPFLVKERRVPTIQYTFTGYPTLKHLIEALGVPHTEVGCAWVGGCVADLSTPVQDGDRVEVSPADPQTCNLGSTPRFILDNHLGRLAAYLRMLGLDCLYSNAFQDEELAQLASQERRVLLTRDRRLLMRKLILEGYWVRSVDPITQVVEVLQRYRLSGRLQPFQRCLRCNALLEPVDKTAILDRLEPLTRLHYDEFSLCPSCGQIYWKGSHYEHMQEMIQRLTHP